MDGDMYCGICAKTHHEQLGIRHSHGMISGEVIRIVDHENDVIADAADSYGHWDPVQKALLEENSWLWEFMHNFEKFHGEEV